MSVQAVGSARGGARGGRDVRRRDGGLLDRPGERGRAHRPSTFNGAIEVRMETVTTSLKTSLPVSGHLSTSQRTLLYQSADTSLLVSGHFPTSQRTLLY